MPGCVRDRKAGLGRERFDRALALGNYVQDLQPMRARDRLANPRKLGIEPVFEVALRACLSNHLFNIVFEYAVHTASAPVQHLIYADSSARAGEHRDSRATPSRVRPLR